MTPRVEDGYLGQRLFHFWRHQNDDQAFDIFTSIMERGFLLTCDDGPLICRFSFETMNGREAIDILQRSRVCFTDIPEDKLDSHAKKYGTFGVGFDRRTILRWGGIPVWYLPNHPDGKSLVGIGAYYVRGILNAEVGLEILRGLFNKWKSEHLGEYRFFESINWGRRLTRDEVEELIDSGLRAVQSIQSHVKEMSPHDDNDHAYLYEREWRIVSGIGLPGINPFRELHSSECAALIRVRPAWGKPQLPTDPLPNHTYPKVPLVNRFHYFNGIPHVDTVSQGVEVVYVPNGDLKERVEKYVVANPKRFNGEGVEVRVFSA